MALTPWLPVGALATRRLCGLTIFFVHKGYACEYRGCSSPVAGRLDRPYIAACQAQPHHCRMCARFAAHPQWHINSGIIGTRLDTTVLETDRR